MNKSKRNVTKKNNQYNYFEFPRSVPLPKFRIPKDLITVVIKNLKPFHDMTKTSMEYMNILKILKNKRLDVGEKNHLQILKLLLYVEEVQNNEDMKIYDQHNKNIIRISKSKQYFKIFIDGLMENRPSVRFNDIVEVYDLKSCTLNLLIVINVMNDHIIAVANNQFCIGYKPEKVYNIRFRFSNYSLRCCHYALYLIKLFELTPYFFPTKRVTHINETQNRLWFNEEIENNPEQKQAVLNILCKSSFPSPYILYGPPGTGKTATLIEAICQVWQNDPSIHILVCTPSNSAADLITERLLKYIDEKNLYRMYSSSKNVSEIYDGIVNCSNYVDGQIMMLPKHLVIVKSIIICTLCACTRLLFLGLREKHFSYIFIDEAGQATEPEAMIPFNLLSSVREGRIGRLHGQVILAGDPHQLGPGIRSKIAEPILGKSLFERLLTCEAYQKNEHNNYNSNYVTKLVRNYRSHPSIIQVSNELFYDNELKACGNENVRNAEGWAHLKNPKLPIVFHGIIGDERKHFNSPSIKRERFIKLADEIGTIFASPETSANKVAKLFYYPFQKSSTKKFNISAGGILYDKYMNYRKLLIKNQIIARSERIQKGV